MKKIEIKSSFFFLYMLVSFLLACRKDDKVESAITNRGFIEYQYSDTLASGIVLRPYKRANILSAYFTSDTSIKLPDSLAGTYRPIKLVLQSQLLVNDPDLQSVGSSLVQFTMIDSISNSYNAGNSITPYTFNYQSSVLNFLRLNPKRPVWNSFSVKINLQSDTSQYKYERVFNGQTTKPVYCMYYGSGVYQIIANGLANNNTYNIYYTGAILPKF